MKKVILWSMALCISVMSYGQRSDNGQYWTTFEYVAKDGMTAKFMEAAAEKTAKFNGEDNAMSSYRVMTGRNTGTIVRIQGPLKSVDYDKDRTAEANYWRDNVGKFIANARGTQIWRYLNNGSLNFNTGDGGPSKYFYRVYVDVKPDGVSHFRRFQHRISKTLEKRNWNGSRGLFRLESGGNENLYAIILPFNTYKSDPQPENENSFRDDYDDLFGWGSFEEDRNNYNKAIEAWGEHRETLQLIPSMTTGMMN